VDETVEQGGDVGRLYAGDPRSWEALYRRMYPSMLAYATRRVATTEEAQDAVSDALTRTVAGLDRMAASGATPEAWVFGVLRHVVLDRQRAAYRQRELPARGTVVPDDPLEAVVHGEEATAVRAAFARLGPRDREILELRVVAGLSADEVAAVLDMRPGAVRTAQSRALERLRGMLVQAEGVPR
jgi:RNA polymerase sigma-70 factor (ECF subfamily)